MHFPHLLLAITNWGPHYKLARAVGCSESRLSRCLYGRSTFTDEEDALQSPAPLASQSDGYFSRLSPRHLLYRIGLIHAHSYRNLKAPLESVISTLTRISQKDDQIGQPHRSVPDRNESRPSGEFYRRNTWPGQTNRHKWPMSAGWYKHQRTILEHIDSRRH